MSKELGDAARAQELAQLLLGKTADGAYAVEDRAAKATVVLLSLGVVRGDPTTQLSPFIMEQLATFCGEAGVTAATPPAELLSKMEAYLLSLIPVALQRQLEAFYREELSRGGPAAQEAVASLLGLKKSAGALDSGARPVGTTAAGPMARFALKPKEGPKGK